MYLIIIPLNQHFVKGYSHIFSLKGAGWDIFCISVKYHQAVFKLLGILTDVLVLSER